MQDKVIIVCYDTIIISWNGSLNIAECYFLDGFLQSFHHAAVIYSNIHPFCKAPACGIINQPSEWQWMRVLMRRRGRWWRWRWQQRRNRQRPSFDDDMAFTQTWKSVGPWKSCSKQQAGKRIIKFYVPFLVFLFASVPFQSSAHFFISLFGFLCVSLSLCVCVCGSFLTFLWQHQQHHFEKRFHKCSVGRLCHHHLIRHSGECSPSRQFLGHFVQGYCTAAYLSPHKHTHTHAPTHVCSHTMVRGLVCRFTAHTLARSLTHPVIYGAQ